MIFSCHPKAPIRRLRAWVSLAGCLAWFLPAGIATAPGDKVKFDLPADFAAIALRRFADQSGIEVLIRADLSRLIRTNQVRGLMNPRQALERMFAGSGLEVAEDRLSGALALHPISRPANPAPASRPSYVPEEGNHEEILKMSAFEVQTTQGHGYVATNAATALKTNESIMDIPQSIYVITNDLINDVGAINTSDAVRYFGASPGFEGESLHIRGVNARYPFVDDMQSVQSYEDNARVDTYEIIKGPGQVMYINAEPTGSVLKVTKKPLPYYQEIVTAQVNDWGQFRFVGDATGPVGTIGDAKIGTRVVVMGQGGGNWAQNNKDSRRELFNAWEVKFPITTVRWDFDYQYMEHNGEGNCFLGPDGRLFTGAGRTEVNMPPDDVVDYESDRYAAHVLTKLSQNWESKFQASVWNYWGPMDNGIVLLSAVNYANQMLTFLPRLDKEQLDEWNVQDDFHGDYRLLGLRNQDAFGFAYTDYDVLNDIISTAGPSLNVPYYSAAAINAVHVYQAVEYPPAASIGNRSETVYYDLYWAHTIDIIPNILSGVVGYTWAGTQLNTVANESIVPYIDTQAMFQQFLHRFGVVLKPIKDMVSIYALNETTFFPPNASQLVLVGNALNLAPPQLGEDKEIGIKTSFLGGKISTDFAYFHMSLTNVLENAGVLANGFGYYAPVGFTLEKGYDGDIGINLGYGWQMFATFFSGGDRDQLGNPVSGSYDNSWSVFTRYDFAKGGALHGLSVGAGMNVIGGQWIGTSGLSGVKLPTIEKYQQGAWAECFFSYQVTRHLSLRLRIDNIVNQAFAAGIQNAEEVDPSPPRTWYFSGAYKF